MAERTTLDAVTPRWIAQGRLGHAALAVILDDKVGYLATGVQEELCRARAGVIALCPHAPDVLIDNGWETCPACSGRPDEHKAAANPNSDTEK